MKKVNLFNADLTMKEEENRLHWIIINLYTQTLCASPTVTYQTLKMVNQFEFWWYISVIWRQVDYHKRWLQVHAHFQALVLRQTHYTSESLAYSQMLGRQRIVYDTRMSTISKRVSSTSKITVWSIWVETKNTLALEKYSSSFVNEWKLTTARYEISMKKTWSEQLGDINVTEMHMKLIPDTKPF